jgi:ppGpp synthetase/RelA/SpoT-type nucleotidyltranferase
MPQSARKSHSDDRSKKTDACRIDQDTFLRRYGLTEEAFQTTGLEWSLLEHIHERHTGMTEELRSAADYISGRLQLVPAVHSLKIRVKNAEHLIEKIIRKKAKTGDLNFDCTTYESLITDLIGIRALHLFKDEWKDIHKFVVDTWDLLEEPLAYVREGDQSTLVQDFRDAGCRVEEHPFGYRSIHYVLKTQPAKCVRLIELQVRTIFEEGWSEIDHRVRYPRQSDNPYLAGFLTIFNRLAGAADEMGTFTNQLNAYIHAQAEQAAENERLIHEQEDELKKAVSQLQISKEEKARLERHIAVLSRSSTTVTVAPSTRVSVLGNFLVNTAAPKGVTVAVKTCTACHQIFIESLHGEDGTPSDQCASCKAKSVLGGITISP